MSVKYKIENSKKNKNLIGDEVSVSKIKKPGGRGPKGPKPPRVTVNQLAQNMTELTTTVGKLTNTVSQLAKEMREGFTSIRKDIDHIVDANNLTR